MLDVALACKTLARSVAFGDLGGPLSTGWGGPIGGGAGHLPSGSDHEMQRPPAQAADGAAQESMGHAIFVDANHWGGHLAGMASAAVAEPLTIPEPHPRGKCLLVFDALEDADQADLNVALGSVFSVLRAPPALADGGRELSAEDFLQGGVQQVAAGYALYGPATQLVLTVGTGVHGFTLDPNLGEFKLTQPDIRIPADTDTFAINAANSRFWEAPVKRYVDECLAGKSGPRGKDFSTRWIASPVAEAHRILMRGGVFLCPRDAEDTGRPGCPGLLHQANPLAMLIEQAGGRASTGREPVLQRVPGSLSQRTGLVFGSQDEVQRIERYHREPTVFAAFAVSRLNPTQSTPTCCSPTPPPPPFPARSSWLRCCASPRCRRCARVC
jgi:fructose-1,6-bisphosphatase I/sedoheptulose-1,7-bisphosphatase